MDQPLPRRRRHLEETPEDKRLRRAACLLSDIAWRAHPDYRAEQSHDSIVNATLIGIDHPSRAYLALRHPVGTFRSTRKSGSVSRSLVSARQLDRARILGAAMRVAYIVSAAMPGVLPRAPMTLDGGKVTVSLPPELVSLNSERLQSRLKQFARLIGGDPEIRAMTQRKLGVDRLGCFNANALFTHFGQCGLRNVGGQGRKRRVTSARRGTWREARMMKIEGTGESGAAHPRLKGATLAAARFSATWFRSTACTA